MASVKGGAGRGPAERAAAEGDGKAGAEPPAGGITQETVKGAEPGTGESADRTGRTGAGAGQGGTKERREQGRKVGEGRSRGWGGRGRLARQKERRRGVRPGARQQERGGTGRRVGPRTPRSTARTAGPCGQTGRTGSTILPNIHAIVNHYLFIVHLWMYVSNVFVT